jgi:hypothetical protein
VEKVWVAYETLARRGELMALHTKRYLSGAGSPL